MKKLSINELLKVIVVAGIRFAYLIRRDDGVMEVSHRQIEPLRDAITASSAFAKHEAIFVGQDPKFQTLFFAFVHNTTRGLAQGGCRMKEYDDVDQVVWDGLRLSQGMTRKNAVCHLNWGGGKGIIPVTPELIAGHFGGDLQNQAKRDELFAAYGEFVAAMKGIYYTAADIGTYNADMLAILSTNRFVTCLPEGVGGSGDPSPHTADGVFRTMKTVLEHLKGTDDLRDVKVAVQGAGKVGKPLIEKLTAAGAKIWASDPKFDTLSSPDLAEFKAKFPAVKIVPCGARHENDIFALNVDIVAPCAAGGVINREVIEKFKPSVKILCGGANNILDDEAADGELLARKSIVFIPDFACNWMGIYNCANEWMGYLEEDVQIALDRVPGVVRSVLEKAATENISHTAAAHGIADEKAKELPFDELLRNRGQRILTSLVNKRREATAG